MFWLLSFVNYLLSALIGCFHLVSTYIFCLNRHSHVNYDVPSQHWLKFYYCIVSGISHFHCLRTWIPQFFLILSISISSLFWDFKPCCMDSTASGWSVRFDVTIHWISDIHYIFQVWPFLWYSKFMCILDMFHILRHAKFQEFSTYWCISLKFLFRNSYKLWWEWGWKWKNFR